MKKTIFLFWVGFLVCSPFVTADKMNLCQAFALLDQQCDDFSVMKGDAIKDDFGHYVSSLEVIGSSKSYINAMLSDNVSFVAEYGSFDSEAKAIEKVESLQKELIACFPSLKFAVTSGDFRQKISYVVANSNEGFRCYKSYFKVANWGQTWSISFEYPQSSKALFSSALTKPYTDYRLIKEEADQTAFSIDFRRLLNEAKTGFESIKGEKLDWIKMFDHYRPTFMPVGAKDCYIEDRSLGIIFYEIPIVKGVNQETLQNNAGSVFQSLQKTLGSQYGFSQSADGLTVNFAHVDRPYFNVVTLYIEKEGDVYNLSVSIRADRKPL